MGTRGKIVEVIHHLSPKVPIILCFRYDSSVFIFSDRLRSETAILGKLYLKHFQTDTSVFIL